MLVGFSENQILKEKIIQLPQILRLIQRTVSGGVAITDSYKPQSSIAGRKLDRVKQAAGRVIKSPGVPNQMTLLHFR